MTPVEIDFLLDYIDQVKPDQLDLKNEPFLNSVIDDYLLSNFNDLREYVKDANWEPIVQKYMSLYYQLQEIHKKHGKIIVDFYLAKVKDIYNIPEDKIQFQLDDTMEEIENEKIDKEDIEEEEDFNTALRDEINHLHIKNALVNGGALYNWDKLFTDIKDDLDLIDPEIYPVVTDFCKYAQFVAYAQIPVKGVGEMIAGSEQLEFPEDDNEKTIVKVKGTNFVIVCHEIMKGVLDIYSEHSFPRHLPPHAQKYVRKITSDLYYERWVWLFGRKLFEIHVDKKFNENGEDPYYIYLYKIFKKPYNELLQFLTDF